MQQFKVSQEAKIKSDSNKHPFKVGDIVVIQRVTIVNNSEMYICRLKDNEKRVSALTVDDIESI